MTTHDPALVERIAGALSAHDGWADCEHGLPHTWEDLAAAALDAILTDHAVVKLPEPWHNVGGSPVWAVSLDGEGEAVSIGPKGGVSISGVETFDERDIPALAAALLAAAIAAESGSTTPETKE